MPCHQIGEQGVLVIRLLGQNPGHQLIALGQFLFQLHLHRWIRREFLAPVECLVIRSENKAFSSSGFWAKILVTNSSLLASSFSNSIFTVGSGVSFLRPSNALSSRKRSDSRMCKRSNSENKYAAALDTCPIGSAG